MRKTMFIEPSGNEFSLKCKVKDAESRAENMNFTQKGNGPVQWYQDRF